MKENTLYWAIILLFGPLTKPEPITNQNQDKTKQDIMVKNFLKTFESPTNNAFNSRIIYQ